MVINKIKADRILSMKNKDSYMSSLLGILLSDIIKIGKDKRNGETTDDEAISVIKKYIKTNKDNLLISGLTEEQKNQYSKEIIIFSSYLPEQVSEEVLKKFLNENKGKNKGEIFKLLKEKFGSNFDASLVNKLLS